MPVLIRLGAGALGLFALAGPASAQVLDEVERGWYFEEGYRELRNYYAGFCEFCFTGSGEYRSWFVFDLGGITTPITGARLMLTQPTSGYQSPDPTEIYALYDVTTPPSALIDGTGGVAAYDDLGTGTLYGWQAVSEDTEGTVVSIRFNDSGVAALDQATGLFAIGGAVVSLGPYGATFGGSTGSQNRTRLILETAPLQGSSRFEPVPPGNGGTRELPASPAFPARPHAWVVLEIRAPGREAILVFDSIDALPSRLRVPRDATLSLRRF